MLIGELEQRTTIRFRTFDDFETFIKAIDVDYDSDDVIFTGCWHKLKTHQIKKVKKSQYRRGTDFNKTLLNIEVIIVVFQRMVLVFFKIYHPFTW